MEHWQFLIQKQGDRSWHTLESPTVEILEGRYRLLARSHRPNTDVEVRVTHSSTQEFPPKRRIQKRSCRTNSEGLMAVVPFTYFKPGVWELQCSGDLLSDILGKSWQYTVYLQVLSESTDAAVPTIDDGEMGESNSTADFDTPSPVESASAPEQAIALKAQSRIITSYIRNNTVANTQADFDTPIAVESASAPEQAIALTAEAIIITEDIANHIEITTKADFDTPSPVESASAPEQAIALTAEAIIITDDTANNRSLLTQTEDDVVIDQPVSPVWFKGETAEQILQNLIEFALPGSESLLEDEKLEDSSATAVSPLLSLTLEREIYVAHWGEALTINGKVELKQNLNPEDNIQYPTSLYGLELIIELRSPVGGKILTRKCQPLPDEVLPFTIRYAIDIPADCETKLILADITLHGALTELGEVIMLASHCFSITADVTALLTITAPAKPSTPTLCDQENTALTSPADPEPEPSVSLDLSLFNLVKSNKKQQPVALKPSVKKSLPPRLDGRSLKQSTASRAPQLPNLPPIPIKAMTNSDRLLAAEGVGGAIATTVVTEEAPAQDNFLDKDNTITPINLDQLVIRNRSMRIISKSFPYLKRLTTVPTVEEELDNKLLDELVDDRSIDEDTPELVAGDVQLQHESAFEVAAAPSPELIEPPAFEVVVAPSPELIEPPAFEVAVAPSPELIEPPAFEVAVSPSPELIIEGNPNSSPLIRKWLQSQGYTLPEEDYNTYVPPPPPSIRNQVPLPPPPPPPVNINLPTVEVKTTILENAEVTKPEDDQIPENTEEAQPEDTIIQADLQPENQLTQVAPLARPVPPLPPPRLPKKPPAWLSQEIVVDDIYIEPEAEVLKNTITQPESAPESDNSLNQAMTTIAISEPLPIPELYVPEGELIAGNSVTIRVELPALESEVAVKLWVEDYQTRWILLGPDLLKNLQPNSLGGLEVITQLKVPFGCLEIRVEAIAIDLVTQQESHKVTIVRSVVPPNLPSLRLDELLGI